MQKMTEKDYQELIDLLDGRIDQLTRPLPSTQIIRFAKALETARFNEDDSTPIYSEQDYENLLDTELTVQENLSAILANIRAKSVDPEKGWKFEKVKGIEGDHGKCAICRAAFQHFEATVKAHCIDTRPGTFYGVCRPCVGEYAPLEFIECDEVSEWFNSNPYTCVKQIDDHKTEAQRVALIDAVREHAESTHYFGNIMRQASDWLRSSWVEWR